MVVSYFTPRYAQNDAKDSLTKWGSLAVARWLEMPQGITHTWRNTGATGSVVVSNKGIPLFTFEYRSVITRTDRLPSVAQVYNPKMAKTVNSSDTVTWESLKSF